MSLRSASRVRSSRWVGYFMPAAGTGDPGLRTPHNVMPTAANDQRPSPGSGCRRIVARVSHNPTASRSPEISGSSNSAFTVRSKVRMVSMRCSIGHGGTVIVNSPSSGQDRCVLGGGGEFGDARVAAVVACFAGTAGPHPPVVVPGGRQLFVAGGGGRAGGEQGGGAGGRGG